MSGLEPELAIWASLFLNLIPIAVLYVVTGLIKRLNEMHDLALKDIKHRIELIDAKFDKKWDEHLRLHLEHKNPDGA